ncbi:nucleoside-diphosphate kinase [Aerococcaceae bacterium WGS1372]
MTIQQTYIMIKPDAVLSGKVGRIISRIEDKGYRTIQAKLMTLTADLVKEHYAHLLDKPFFPKLEAYILSGPVFAMVVEGECVIEGMRRLMGPTNALEANPGTIRGDFGKDVTYNAIHGSDSIESAEIEIKRFFG